MQVSLFTKVDLSGKPKSTVELFDWLGKTAPTNTTKETAPAITPCGLFSGARKRENLVKHSGYAFIDIDAKDNRHIPNFAGVKPELCKLPEVAYCATSFSGTGYHMLVRIGHAGKHAEHYRALMQAFKSIGLNCDHSCSDVTRLKIMSRDLEPYINENARPFNGAADKAPVRAKYAAPVDVEANLHTANAILSAVEALNFDFAPEYKDYIKTAFALAHGLNEAGRDLFHRACQYSPKYDPDHADRQFDDALANGRGDVTFASFVATGQPLLDFKP
ncbi:BT4734/BF3469 family protein [Niabella sp.]|uniref:BT4734/BF3469 family protein n=1 Tax=Niabella sp. TaxID=1962976 RepID=UPI002627A149|nr:BT4734/BF3469 family protein [Niabella sp.]